MVRDLEAHDTWVIEQSGKIMGFAVCERKSGLAAEILWLSVLPEEQGRGLGSALIAALVADARRAGVVALEVKTLAATVESPLYARTRHYYEGHGFILLDVIDPFPGWAPGNPCAIYVRPLESSTRE